MYMGSSLLISAGTEGFMNCFSNVEKWFMNQREKCSPKPASISNDFYSWSPPIVSFVFRKDGMGITESLQGGGRGGGRAGRDKGGTKGGQIGEVVPEAAAVGSGCDS